MLGALSPDDPREISGYPLRGTLGSGGMGRVYLSHTRGGQPVALKVIRREFAENPEFRRRFAREVAAARRVQGAYTAAVLDSNTEGEQPWLASAYVPGPPLAGVVAEHGPLPFATLLMLTAGIAEALQSVHAAGVVHRDLKPSNVLLASDGPRVIDFGIARAGDATALTGTDVRLGTPAYMSPEQAEGLDAGPAIDVFALGLVVFYAATGRHPFGEGDGLGLLYRIVSREPDLGACPEPLRPLVAGCLAKDPAGRPRPEAVIDACRRLADAHGVDLTRGEGWWLPRQVAEDATAMEAAPRQPAAPAQLSYTPTEQATAPAPSSSWPAYPPAAPEPFAGGPAPEAPARTSAAPAASGRRSRGRIVAVVVAALVVGGGGGWLAANLDGKGGTGGIGGGTPVTSADYKQKRTDVSLRIPAPTYTAGSYVDGGACEARYQDALSGSVFVDLGGLKSAPQQVDAKDADIDDAYTLRYTDCANGDFNNDGDAGGAGPTSGLRMLENRGTWGTVSKRDISADDCRSAAESGDLGAGLSISQIQKGEKLKKDMGICVKLSDNTLDLLWITNVITHKENDNLSDFVIVATQWQPK